jgi:tetratricopeptide (TPR) repeat protein
MTPAAAVTQPDIQQWTALRTWLESDQEGRDLLARFLRDPSAEKQALENWLNARAAAAPAQISTIITGGHVDNLVNIASADKVILNFTAARESLHQLPADIRDFTGRTEEISHCKEAIVRAAGAGTATPLIAVSGMPGVGKSTLAIRICHELAEAYPDAQLYLNLRGDDGQPVTAMDALGSLLLALGVASTEFASGMNGRATQFRGLIAGRKALVLLDNAHSEDQTRPLIPASSTCVVIVTSRSSLPALDTTFQIKLDVLLEEEGLDLLTRVAGPVRIAEDPANAARLVSLTGGLPLALRITGGTLRQRSRRTIASFVDSLSDEQKRISTLQLGDLQVRSSFDLSYRELTPGAQKVFRFLGALPGPFVDEDAVSHMIGESSAAGENLDRLLDAQLIEAVRGDRYRLHDLVRLFARERFEADETPEERRKSWERLGNWYAPIAQLANSYIQEGKPSATGATFDQDLQNQKLGAFAWFDLEWLNLLKVATELQSAAIWPVFFRLVDPLLWYLLRRGRAADGVALAESACEAAHKLGESETEAAFLNTLGGLQSQALQWAEAQKSFDAGLALVRSGGNRLAELGMLVNLSLVQAKLQEHDKALTNLEQAIAAYESEFPQQKTDLARALVARGDLFLENSRWSDALEPLQTALKIAHETSELPLQSAALLSLGVAFRSLGRWQDAINAYSECGQIAKLLGDEHRAAEVLLNISAVYNDQGQWDDAIRVSTSALDVFRRFKDQSGQAGALNSLATHYTDVGKFVEAKESLEASLEIRSRLGDLDGAAGVLANLGNLAGRQHAWENAIARYSDALKIYARLGLIYEQALMQLNIGSAEVQLSRFDDAIANLSAALPEVESRQDLLSASKAVLNLGLAYANTGQLDKAIDYYNRALQSFRNLGDPQGYGSVCHNVGRLYASMHQWKEATAWYEKDLAICVKFGDKPGALTTLWEIGSCWFQLEDLPKAESTFTEYLRIAREISFLEAQGRVLANLAMLAGARGDGAKALQLAAESLKILTQLKMPEASNVEALLKTLNGA